MAFKDTLCILYIKYYLHKFVIYKLHFNIYILTQIHTVTVNI